MSTTQSKFHSYNPRYWPKPEARAAFVPTAGHPPQGVFVPVRTNWEDRQPTIILDEVLGDYIT